MSHFVCEIVCPVRAVLGYVHGDWSSGKIEPNMSYIDPILSFDLVYEHTACDYLCFKSFGESFIFDVS